MASIKKDYNSMGLPMNINRSNPIPVDCTELWYSLEEAQNYARNDPRAYVGQSVKVVDETSNATTVYVIKDTAGNLMQLADIDSAGSGGSGGNSLGIIVDSTMDPTSTNPVQNKVIYEALLNKADKEHTHDNLQLYDTVTGFESIDINAAMPQCPIEVTLSSEVYADLSQITVVFTSDSGTQNATSDADGVVNGLNSESNFTLSLQSDMADFDPSQVTIACTYPLDVSRALHDYVLYVDLEGGDDSGDIDDTIIVDDTLSISGAAADAKATGDRFRTIDERLNEALVGMRSASYPIVETTETTLEPDKYYVFGTVDSLVVTLQDIDDGYTHEHCFEFTTADEFYGMSITPQPKWVDEPSIESNKTYQVSILRGIGVIAGA